MHNPNGKHENFVHKKSPVRENIMYQEGKIALTRTSDLSHIEISKQMHMFITCIWVQNKKNLVKQL